MAYGLRLTALVGALACALPSSLPAQQLVIRFFDVGQGDAALIVSPEGRTALIDAGPEPWAVLTELRRLHIDTLDLVVASHNHSDHIGGLPAVLDSLPVRHYIDNGRPAPTAIYEAVLRVLERRRIDVLDATPRTLTLGSVQLRILARSPDAETQNNSSVGVLLTYGEFTALFTGDAEIPARDYWRTHAGLSRVMLLKVAHHGAANGTDAAWEKLTSPCYAVISVGPNDYGHPSAGTIRTLRKGGAKAYRTDWAGTVEVAVNPAGAVAIRTAKPSADSVGVLSAAPGGCPAPAH